MTNTKTDKQEPKEGTILWFLQAYHDTNNEVMEQEDIDVLEQLIEDEQRKVTRINGNNDDIAVSSVLTPTGEIEITVIDIGGAGKTLHTLVISNFNTISSEGFETK